VYDDVVAHCPVHWRSDPVFVASLKGVEHTKDLGCIPSSRGRVREDQANGFLGINDEYRPDGEGNALGVDIGGVLVVNHVVRERDLPLLVADDGKCEFAAGELFDVLDPSFVRVDRVGGQTNELCAALGELGLKL
jgi:hypothetical protein